MIKFFIDVDDKMKKIRKRVVQNFALRPWKMNDEHEEHILESSTRIG